MVKTEKSQQYLSTLNLKIKFGSNKSSMLVNKELLTIVDSVKEEERTP